MSAHVKTQSQPLTETLVRYIREFRIDAIDAHTRRWTKWCILDMFGCSLAAWSPRFTGSAILERFVREQGCAPAAAIIGRPLRTAPSLAAMVNGTLGYYCDNEPRHTESIVHILPPAVAAALAAGEVRGATGADLLAASVLGVEIACRISLAANPRALYARGFHPTSVAGVFGAAVAAGYLMNLDEHQWRCALGLATQQASGLLAWVGDPAEHSRPLNPGLAARNGVTAASLAALGLGGPLAPFEGQYDFFSAFTGERHEAFLTEGLGGRFLAGEMAAKRHAACGLLLGGLDALLALTGRETLASRDIVSMALHLPSAGAVLVDNNKTRSHRAQYVLAVGAVRGRVTIEDIMGEPPADSEVDRLSRAITVVHDDSLDQAFPRQFISVLDVATADGRTLTERVDYPKGWPQNPMTDDEWMSKYMSMAAAACGERQARRIADLTLDMEQIPRVADLAAALSAG